MQIIFKNLKEANTKLRLIPSTYATSDLGAQTGAVVKDQGVINMCFSPHVKPVITCADALTGISFAGKVDEMLRGKTVNIVMGNTSKGVVIPVDAADPINLFNTRLDGIISIILAYSTDEGWGFDSGIAATDDVKVEILPLDANDDSLTHWVQLPHIDTYDINRGINPTMNQDALGISFCMVKYHPE